jgi:hypothetical protein
MFKSVFWLGRLNADRFCNEFLQSIPMRISRNPNRWKWTMGNGQNNTQESIFECTRFKGIVLWQLCTIYLVIGWHIGVINARGHERKLALRSTWIEMSREKRSISIWISANHRFICVFLDHPLHLSVCFSLTWTGAEFLCLRQVLFLLAFLPNTIECMRVPIRNPMCKSGFGRKKVQYSG